MYSKQDLEKLNGNLKKIEEFCRQNYIPRIPRREDRICVDFWSPGILSQTVGPGAEVLLWHGWPG